MKRSPWMDTARLAAGAAIAVAFAVFFDRAAEPPSRGPLSQPLFPLLPEAVEFLSVKTGDYAVECRAGPEGWRMISPHEARADRAMVERLLQTLRTMRARERITTRQRVNRGLTWASYGLEPPRAVVRVGARGRWHEVWIGDQAPMGDLVYVRLDGGTDVLAVPRETAEALPARAEDFRDRALLYGAPTDVARMDIAARGGFIQVVLRGGEWRITQPVDARADGEKVGHLLAALFGARVERFVGEAGADLVAYGLGQEDAVVRVAVHGDQGRWTQEVAFGKPLPDGGLVYARVDSDLFVTAVAADLPARFDLRAADLRDRRVWPFGPTDAQTLFLQDGDRRLVFSRAPGGAWMLVEPTQARADEIMMAELLKSALALRVAEFGGAAEKSVAEAASVRWPFRLAVSPMAPPAGTNMPAVAPPSEWLLEFAPPEEGAETTAGRLGGVEPILLRAAGVRALLGMGRREAAAGVSDPLLYRDRVLVNAKPEQIRRITLSVGEQEEILTSDAGGHWIVESPPGAEPDREALAELLQRISPLRAARAAALADASQWASFGLDPPVARLTFGLTGDSGAGAQRMLLFGGACGEEGVYIMAQGRPVVFVLPRALADQLTRSLVK